MVRRFTGASGSDLLAVVGDASAGQRVGLTEVTVLKAGLHNLRLGQVHSLALAELDGVVLGRGDHLDDIALGTRSARNAADLGAGGPGDGLVDGLALVVALGIAFLSASKR